MMFVAIMAIIAVGAKASTEQPACETGFHYEGEYVENTTCKNVCTQYFWMWCIRWEEQCETTGEWVGSCVEDEVIEEEPIEEEEPEIQPVVGNSSFIYTRPQVVSMANYNITVNENSITVNYLTSQFMIGGVLVKEVGTEEWIKFMADEPEYTYHTVKLELPAGFYQIKPYAIHKGMFEFEGNTNSFIVE